MNYFRGAILPCVDKVDREEDGLVNFSCKITPWMAEGTNFAGCRLAGSYSLGGYQDADVAFIGADVSSKPTVTSNETRLFHAHGATLRSCLVN